jgi:hypothetical protein
MKLRMLYFRFLLWLGLAVCVNCLKVVRGDDLYEGYGCPRCHSCFVVMKL